MYNVTHLETYKSNKIIPLKQAVRLTSQLKKDGKTIGLCNGGFDLLHPGQVRHFESAKKLCDVLVVCVASDSKVQSRKGDGRPIFAEELRAYMIAHLDCVDYVSITDDSGRDIIYKIKPSVYIKGPDFIEKQTPGITAERKAVVDVGGKMVYTRDPKLSTTEIITYIQSLAIIKLLVVLDRDGTLITNDETSFGSQSDWKQKLRINLPVVNFLSYLETKYRPIIIVASNQSGVARGYINEARVNEINSAIDTLLQKQSITVDNWQYSPDMDKKYIDTHPELKVRESYVHKITKRKPSIAMVIDGLTATGKSLAEFSHVLVIGDSKDDEGLAQNLKAKFIHVKGKSYKDLIKEYNIA